MVQMDPEKYYTERLSHFSAKIHSTRKRLKMLAFLRMAVFLVTVIMVVIATRWGMTSVIISAITGLSIFIVILIRYLNIQRQLRKDENLADINENEMKALRGKYPMFPDGSEFNDPDHPYLADLDIFGPQSLFQYINRSASNIGKHRLAEFLSNPLKDTGIIIKRQEAVNELAVRPDFRQDFQATGYMASEQPADKQALLDWVSEPAQFNRKKFLFLLVFIPVLTFTVLTLAFTSVISPSWALLYITVPFGITGRYLKTINRKYGMLTGKAELMKKYSGLFATIEQEKFNSHEMASQKQRLNSGNHLPSEATKHLSAILDAFDVRNNILAGFLLNFLFLWDLIQVLRTEKWQSRYRDELPKWLDVLADTDALCSLANFHFNHPGSIFPEVTNDEYLVNAKGLGHPLISAAKRINNPARLLCRRHFTIVSGANMAGKSTYLRTVGITMVLAMAGSAVIAEEMTFQPAGLVTSIRTRDSLQKNESYFYAELKKLKYIIERLQKGERLVILLDEILKGTNSKDKQGGSIALLEKLLRFDATGLIATHDLALGEMEQTHPGNITNKCFEVIIENDTLVFDYKLKDGIARQMNATFLMKKMGITD